MTATPVEQFECVSIKEDHQQSIPLLHAILESLRDGILAVDHRGAILEYNTRFADMWSIPRTILSSGDAGEALRCVHDQLKLLGECTLEGTELWGDAHREGCNTLECKDGRIIELYMKPLRTGPTFVGHVVTFRDVTAHKQAESALRESEEKWRSLVEHSPDIIINVDRNGTILFINQTVRGFTRDDVVGNSLYDYTHPTQHDTMREALERVYTTGQSERYEITGPGDHGLPTFYESRIEAVKSNDGVVSLNVISTDITHRKQTEQALRESEEKYRTVVNSAPESIVIVGSDGKILSCNPATETLTGYTREELEGKYIHELMTIQPEELPRVLAFFDGLVQGKVADAFELETVRKDGTKYWTSVRLSLFKSGENVKGIVVIARDLTERKLMEMELVEHRDHLKELVEEQTVELRMANERLQREIAERIQAENEIKKLNEELEQRVKERTQELETAYSDLKQLDTMKDEFLSSVSHELRTPLTSIRSFSEILLNYEDHHSEEHKDFIRIINAESERLTRLINDLLDLAKIEAGGVVWNDAPFDIAEVIQDVVKTQGSILQDKAIPIHLEISPDLPAVCADRDRIHQVITNLLGNAVKFSHTGGEIRIRAQAFKGRRSGEGGRWIKVSVSDQGIGIDEKDFRIIFDKFRQVTSDTLRDKPKGTGLGLPISKEIVTHYGGTMWVESTKGRGSTFFFTLPSHSPTPGGT